MSRTISPAQHAAIVFKSHNAPGAQRAYAKQFTTFAQPGEDQLTAGKRLLAALRRQKRTIRRSYPKYAPGMTAAEYIRRFTALNITNQINLLPFQIDTITGASHTYDPSFPEVVEEKDLPKAVADATI